METMERVNANMEEIKKQVGSMEPLLRECSIVVINLSACIRELLNRNDRGAITEMETVCQEIFLQARLALDSMEAMKQ
jgi:hypothetical protein